MNILKIDIDDFLPENLNTLLDSLSVLSDTEIQRLETMCNILMYERRFKNEPKIVNDIVMDQLTPSL
jgi:hypothetical protein